MSSTVPGTTSTQERITTSRITPGVVIAVEKRGEQLVSTRRRTDVLHVTVTDKRQAVIPGGRNLGYLLTTDQGEIGPCPGVQTFPLISAPTVPAGAPDASALVVGGTVVAMVEHHDVTTDAPAGDQVDPGQLWNAYEAERATAEQADGPAPERDDMRPRVEIFRGRKLRTVKGPRWGEIVQSVNGEVVAVVSGSSPESMNDKARQLRRDVIGADERRVTDPDAYPAHWYQGAPAPGPATVAWLRHSAEEFRAAREVPTCTGPYGNIPGTPGCPVTVSDCNGVPTELGDVITESPVRTGPDACGADQVGAEIAARVAIRHTVTDVRAGYSDPGRNRGVREVSTWSMLADGHRVTVVRYEARDALMRAGMPYASVLVDGEHVDRIPASKLEYGTARVVWDYLAELATAVPIGPEAPATVDQVDNVPADDHVYVYVDITDPMGRTHPTTYVGSLPAWTTADGGAFKEWKKARRAGLLETLGMSDRPGFRFRYTVTADQVDPAPAVTVTIEERPSGTPVVEPSADAPYVPAPAPAPEVTRPDVPAGMPYVVDAPEDFAGPVTQLAPKDVAAMLRGKSGFLAAWFPGVRFSVKTGRGCAIDVRWEGGPAADLVELVAKMWQGKDRDSQAERDYYRGVVLYVAPDGTETAYRLPGEYVFTRRERDTAPESVEAARRFVPADPGREFTYGEVADPYGRPFYGGSVEEAARWMAERGVSEWTRRYDDPRPVCPVERCAEAAGHPFPGMHRTDMGWPFLATLPADGDQGGDGGTPTDVDPVDPAPAGDQVDAPTEGRPTFRTWEALAAWITEGRTSVVTAPGPDVPVWTPPTPAVAPSALVLAMARTVDATTSFECPAHGTVTVPDLYDSERVARATRAHAECTPPADVRPLYTVTNDGHGRVRVHAVGCGDVRRDVRREGVTVGDHWDVRADHVRDIVLNIYDDATPETWREFLDVEVMPCADLDESDDAPAVAETTPAPAEEIRPAITVKPWVTAHVVDVPAGQLDDATAPAETLVGEVRVSDLVGGERVHLVGIDQFGSPTHYTGYVSSAPSPTTVKGRTPSGRVSRDPKKARPGLIVCMSANPGGWNGSRMTVVTTPDAYAEHVTDAAHQFRPGPASLPHLVKPACSCKGFDYAGETTFRAGRNAWLHHANEADAVATGTRTVVTQEEIDTAKKLGAEAHQFGCPAPYPLEDAEFLKLVRALPSHIAPRPLEDMYCRGYAERAEREAAHLEQSQEGRRTTLAVAEKVAELNPAAAWAVDSQRAAIESAGRTLADHRSKAAHARALAGDQVEPATDGRTIEQVRAEIRAVLEADAASLVDQAEKAGAQHHATGGECSPMDSPWYCRIASAVPHDSRDTVGAQVTEAFRRGYQAAADAAAPAGDQVDEDGAGAIYTAPEEWYVPAVESDKGGDIVIMHDHEDGTVLLGSRRGDGVYEIAKTKGFEYRRNVGIFIPRSRDQFAQLKRIRECADALRLAGHTVAVIVDDVWRPAAVREEARGARVTARVERLTARSLKQSGTGDARRAAARKLIDAMPFGEPIKIGHHSEGAHRRAFDRIESNQRAAHAAYDYAQHLASRADGAASNEDAKQGPRAIVRRIERLEAEHREATRRIDEATAARAAGSVRYWWLNRERIAEDIAYQRAKLGNLAETGEFVAWGPEDFTAGDDARVSGRWYRVVKVNPKSLSLDGLYTPGYVERAKWDRVHGRRRDGVQLDTPNGKPRDIDQAKRVERWESLMRSYRCASYDRTPENERQRRHMAHAIRVTLGLPRTATAQEVAAFGEPAGEEEKHARALAMLAAFERFEAGETYEQITADTFPLGDTAPRWTMPGGTPELVRAADLVPGDIVCGVIDNFAGSADRLVASMVGPVTAPAVITDRRESGEWYALEVDGELFEGKTFRRIAAHLVGAR